MLNKSIFMLTIILATASCGEDDKNPDVIDAKYQGQWQSATLAPGKTDPVADGCRAHNKIASRKDLLTISSNTFQSNYTYWTDSMLCDGTSTFNIVSSGVMVNVDKNDDRQIFSYGPFTSSVSLNDDTAAAFFNAKEICGRTDWQAKQYSHVSEHMKACTDENGGGILYRIPTLEELAKFRLRIKTQGNGIAYGVKLVDEKDEEYDRFQSFFAKVK